ncbi:MAG: ribosomal protein S18-alanine N-acetyltransferase [Pseudomonadota bacterium]
MSAVMPLPDLLVRAMTHDDLPRVLEIEGAAYGFPWSQKIFEDCLRVGYHCRVLLRDESVVGYGIVSALVNEAHILNVCIDPTHRQQGLGRRFFSHLLALAARKEVSEVFLEVRPSNEAAINLYRQFDFEVVGRRRNYYRAAQGREDALVLKATLTAETARADALIKHAF